jgi:F-type H+-transporting ATPase subunit b
MEILQKFGFEPVLFAAQIVNFLILAFVFKRYLYKPILKVLAERKAKIAQSLEDAEKAHIALEKADAKHDEILKKASNEGQKIIEDAKAGAEELKNEILTKSRADGEKLIKDAREQIDLEMQKAVTEVKGMAIDLSQKVLEKALADLFTKEEKNKILKRNITTLSKYEQKS